MLWFQVPGTTGTHTHFLPAGPHMQRLLKKRNQLLLRILFTADNSWIPILSSKGVTVLLPFLLHCQRSQQAEGEVSRGQPKRSEKETVRL